MKKLQKKLLLLELDGIKSAYDSKIKMLDNIIMYYMDENIISNETKVDTTEITKHNKDIPDIIEDEEDDEYEEEPINQNNDNNDNKQEQINNKPKDIIESLPSDIKNIYRKIMMITHPDKLNDNLNKDLYLDYYRKAVDAKNTNNKIEIIYIAYKLNIEDVFDIDLMYFNQLRYKIAQLNLESKGIERSPFWVWYHTDSEEMKNFMYDQIKKSTNR